MKEMQSRDPFNSFIIGEGTLTIQCGEILIHGGHEICGIISPDAAVNRWAEGKKIPRAERSDDLKSLLRRRPFDYLFSIVNVVNYYALLKESLELPRKYAINYHDALLPRYAGFYPTSWALMCREKTHGVTWHELTNLIDAGHVLKQCRVEIADNDTALTLNAKCYEAAIGSFAELIDDLSFSRATRKKQNLRERTFFPRHKRPPSACVISWNRCAYDIEAFVRALDFAPYTNPLGLPKFAIGTEFIIAHKTEVLPSISKAPPGTVTGIESESLRVSTTSREIVLRELLAIDGQPLSIPDVVRRFGLHEGHRFTDIDPESAKRITRLNASISRHEAFWVKRLATLEGVALPYAARSASPIAPPRHESIPVPIPEEVTRYLASRQPTWDLSDVLLAAFAVYIARILGVSRFDLGYTDPGLRSKLIGLEELFAPQVPLRLEIDNAQGFAATIRSVREQVELTKRHKTYARDAVARYPELRSMANLQREHSLPITVERVTKVDSYKPTFGSEFILVVCNDDPECRWVYDAEVLDKASVTRMLSQFTTLLFSIVNDSDQCIADLPLMTEKEEHRLLVEFNGSAARYSQDRCIHELFEAQVERTPDELAVVFENQKLTYRELNRRANQLAHHLISLGVGPDVLVGICMERSLEMVIGVLGILKAGGAYVPLDPDYPKERLAFILEDTRAPLLLMQQGIVERLPEHRAREICLDTRWEAMARESEENSVGEVTATSLAYVIYTSGSTGQPNGVMIEHKSLTNYLWWVKESLLGDTLHIPVVTSLSFDASLKQLFAPLLRGAGVWILSGDTVTQPSALLRALRTRSKVGLNCVPSLWAAILEAIDADQTLMPSESLTALFVGGERISNELVDKSLALLPHLEIWNLYGPTEATANASAAKMSSTEAVSIGRPISNAQIYILDSNLQPLPIGLVGELHIGGDGLARGYLNRPERTAERFIPNPFSDEPGARLYRTGDLARYLPDGNIEFLGRVDYQVKIRGFRVELEEIESILSQHPGVQEVVVVARHDGPGEKRLVAYLIPQREQAPKLDALRSFLKKKLPDYMVPSAFVFLESLPLTPNGKIDRHELPSPDVSRPELKAVFMAPRTAVEEVMVGIWADVLKTEQVGIRDNFFELGGNSLSAMQVISCIRHAFKVEVPLRFFFKAPTPAAVAATLLQTSDNQQRIEKTASLLLRLVQLSEAQVERMLRDKTAFDRTGEEV